MKNYQTFEYQLVKTVLIDNYLHILSCKLGGISI